MKLKKGMKVLLKTKEQVANELIPSGILKGSFTYHNLFYTPTMVKKLGKVVEINYVLKPDDSEFSLYWENRNYDGQLFEVDGFVYNEPIIERIIDEEKEYDFSTPLGTIHCTLQLAKTIACGYMTMAMLGAEHYSFLADPLLEQIESIETKEE